jgi:hypothetical protein
MEEFYNILRWQGNRPACWFNAQYTSTADNSLSKLFMQEPDAFFQQLSDLGFAYLHGGKQWRIRPKKFISLGSSAELSNFETANFSINGQRNALYIRLGYFEGGVSFSPDNTLDNGFRNYEEPPNHLMLPYKQSVISNETSTNEGDTQQSDGRTNETTTNTATNTTMGDLQVRLLDLLQPLLSPAVKKMCEKNEFWVTHVSDASLEIALAPLVKDQHKEKMDLQSKHFTYVTSPASAHSFLQVEKSQYKVLEQYGVPLQKASISALLSDLIKLQKDAFEEEGIDIFTFKNPEYTRQMMRMVLVK